MSEFLVGEMEWIIRFLEKSSPPRYNPPIIPSTITVPPSRDVGPILPPVVNLIVVKRQRPVTVFPLSTTTTLVK